MSAEQTRRRRKPLAHAEWRLGETPTKTNDGTGVKPRNPVADRSHTRAPMTTASPLSSAPAEARQVRLEKAQRRKGATRRQVESREARGRGSAVRRRRQNHVHGGSRVLSLTHTRSRNCGSRGIFQRRGVGEKEHRPEGRHRRAMTTSRKRAPLGSPGRLQRHDLRESLEGEKERKNNTNARREGPRRLSLGEHRTANGDSSLSSNSAVTRPRVSKVTTTRRRLQGDQLDDFYCMRKNKKRHTRRQVSS